jgi:hypothetical protein
MCNEDLELLPDEIPFDDVRALVERYFHPRKATLDKLYDITTRGKLGHFGLLLDILNRAWTNCKVGGAELTDEVVLDVARDTMEELNKRGEMYR